MRNTSLSELLDTLDNQELGLLKKWLISPFFNKRADVIALFELYKHYRKEKTKLPDKEETFLRLFPNDAYDDHKVRLIMSFLKKHTEQFLLFEQQKQEEVQQKIQLARIYKERKLRKQVNQTLNKVEKLLEQTLERNANYYYLTYQFYVEKFSYGALGDRTKKFPIQQILDNLDRFFVLMKLKYSIEAKKHYVVASINYDCHFLPIILKKLNEQAGYLMEPAIMTFHAGYLTALGYDNKIFYEQYKILFFKHIHYFSAEEKKELFLCGLFSCEYHSNRSDKQALKEVQLLHEAMLKNCVFNSISSHLFRNIAIAALILKKFKWFNNFIENYENRVEGADRDAIISLVKGGAALYKGNFEEALTLLRETRFEDVFHKVAVKMYIVWALFRLNEKEATSASLQALETFLRRHPEITYKQQPNLQWTLFMQKINALNPYDKMAKAKLKEELEKIPVINGRQWLMGHLEETE